MGVTNIALLFPGDDFVPEDESFVVTDLTEGQFSVSGPSSKVSTPVGGSFSITSPGVTDHGDGSFTVSSE